MGSGDVDVIIGYKEADPSMLPRALLQNLLVADETIWSLLCVQNLASFLPSLKKKVERWCVA